MAAVARRLTSYASLPHYAAHMAPVLDELEGRLELRRWAPRSGQTWGVPAGRELDRWQPRDSAFVAAYVDAQRLRSVPLVYLEHGAGQTYVGDPRSAAHPSYSGGVSRSGVFDRVRLFVVPSERVANRWRAVRPDARVAVVGAPVLDRWHAALAVENPASLRPCVAVTFHWNCPLVPETLSAWPHFDRALPKLATWCAQHDVELIGHGHPRLWGAIERRWRHLHVEPVQRWADVLDRATVLVADNSSALFEFASLDRPVVVLNAPWYRRHVEHGLRFWSHVPGVQVDEPADLVGAVEAELEQPATMSSQRARCTAAAYAATDGRAVARAAAAIMEAL